MVLNSMHKVKKNCVIWALVSVYEGDHIYFIISLEYVLTANTIRFRPIYEIALIKSNKNH
jgi:hypothetical protein